MPSDNNRRKRRVLIFSLLAVSALLITPGSLINWQTGNHVVVNAASPPTAIGIDGTGYNSVANNTLVKTPITTAQSPDVIIAFVAISSNVTVNASVSDTFGLTWTQRYNYNFSAYHAQILEYYAIAPYALPGDNIKIQTNTSCDIDLKVFGIAGANTTTTTSAFESSLPTSPNKGGTNSPYVTVSTTHADDMILGLAFFNGSPTATPGTGFSCVGKSCGSFGSNPEAYAQYMVVSSPQTALHVSASLNTPQSWVMIGDALIQLLPSSTTAVSCTPAPVTVGSSTTCTATVTGSSPTGTVSWSTSGAGTFSSNSCTLSSGSCQVTFTPSIGGSSSVIGGYSGDAGNAPSSGSFSLSVTRATSTTTVSCSPTSLSLGTSAICTAKVTGFSPSGNINFTSSDSGANFTSTSCALSSGTCQVSVQPSIVGSPSVNASYAGDVNNAPSASSTSLSVQSSGGTTTTSTAPTTTTSHSATQTTSTSSSTTPPPPPPPLSPDLIIAIVVAIVVIIGAIAASLFIRKRSKKY